VSMDYEAIKARAKEERVSVEKLLAMSPIRDPFYVGTPADWARGRWFAELWERFGFMRGVHLRRIHYRLVSQEQPILLWFDQRPYVNTEACWDNLLNAATSARYLGLVEFDAFIDARNPEVEEYDPEVNGSPMVSVSSDPWALESLPFPELPEVPSLLLTGYDGRQRYHVEIWAEKTTMHEILRPLCERYGLWLLAASGQLTITQVYTAVRRIVEDGRPTRILYLSDLDPEGVSMPVAAARKLEWFQHFTQSPLRDELADLDVRLEQVAITEQQGEDYNLPRTPLKKSVDSEDWRNRHGEGGLELDALEALRPGALQTIMEEAITRYYDPTLPRRALRAFLQARNAIEEREQQALEEFQEQIETITSEYAALEEEIAPRLEAIATRGRETWARAAGALRNEIGEIDLSLYPVPEGEEASEEGIDPLYDSARAYDAQLDAYKAFQGR
jgi:hypothetical protein